MLYKRRILEKRARGRTAGPKRDTRVTLSPLRSQHYYGCEWLDLRYHWAGFVGSLLRSGEHTSSPCHTTIAMTTYPPQAYSTDKPPYHFRRCFVWIVPYRLTIEFRWIYVCIILGSDEDTSHLPGLSGAETHVPKIAKGYLHGLIILSPTGRSSHVEPSSITHTSTHMF